MVKIKCQVDLFGKLGPRVLEGDCVWMLSAEIKGTFLTFLNLPVKINPKIQGWGRGYRFESSPLSFPQIFQLRFFTSLFPILLP